MREVYGVGIVVAGGSGTRIGGRKKQYMELSGKPLMYYAMQAMEQSALIDAMVIVVSAGDEEYVQRDIVERFAFTKVRAVVAGGKERYHSVYAGLCAVHRTLRPFDVLRATQAQGAEKTTDDTIVYIQDAARPFLTEDILRRVHDGVVQYDACVAAVPVKDTIKQTDRDGFVTGTPDRKTLWAMQTPQAFRFPMINDAYNRLMEEEQNGADLSGVTDDAMVLERYAPKQRVYLTEGSYRNIKVTTPEDLAFVLALLA